MRLARCAVLRLTADERTPGSREGESDLTVPRPALSAREFVETITAVEAEKQQFMGEAAALRAELEQAVGDRRELAGQVRALLEEKARAAQELAKGEGELAREREGREQFQHRVREQVELRLGVLQARVEELASRDTLLLGKLADSANQARRAAALAPAGRGWHVEQRARRSGVQLRILQAAVRPSSASTARSLIRVVPGAGWRGACGNGHRDSPAARR